ADLASPLLDEGDEPIGERRTQPLTWDLSPAPAENFGTRPPAIVIRSPVRGFTPCRGPRSATLNLPKPVKFTSSPRVNAPEMPSSTASTASDACFLLPIRLSETSRSTNSAFVNLILLVARLRARESNSA